MKSNTTTPAADAVPASPEATFRFVAIDSIHESPMNPRKHFDPAKMVELAQSIREKGVLTPLLVRPHPTRRGEFELAAGHRRRRAAEKVGVEQLPVIVREMDDSAFLEVLVIENDQREDVHPLEEAAGYRALMLSASYSVERLAERVGRSTKYIYDRIKLLELTQEAQDLFMAGRMTSGHAILLARLTPADQTRAIGTDDDQYLDGGLFVEEHTLFDPTEEDSPEPLHPVDGMKTVSVRELQAWIDKNVRFQAIAPDPMLFPETAEVLTAAREEKEKVVHITHDNFIEPEAKQEGIRTYGPRSWKRVDADEPCEHAITGVIVVGPGRGEAFKVCISKKACAVHWAEEQRAAKRAVATGGNGGETGRDRYAEQRKKDEERFAREEAEARRWAKARPRILEVVAERLKKLPAGPTGALGQFLLHEIAGYGGIPKGLTDYLPAGRNAEDLVRFAAFVLIGKRVAHDYGLVDAAQKVGKALGIDVRAVVDEAAPAEKPAKAAAPKKAAGKPKPGKKAGRRAQANA